MKTRVEAGVGQAGHQLARVAVVDADVGQAGLVDVAQRARDAVLERLGAQDQHVGAPRGLGGHVLAAAEADLQPDLGGVGHQRARIEGPAGGRSAGSRVSISAACRGLMVRDFRRP